MERLISIIKEMGIPYAYDHFAEGKHRTRPFLCYLLPGSDNFSADGKVYHRISEVRLELYTDFKDLSAGSRWRRLWMRRGFFTTRQKPGLTARNYEVLYFFDMEGL